MRHANTAKPSGSSTWNAHTGTPSVIMRPASRSSAHDVDARPRQHRGHRRADEPGQPLGGDGPWTGGQQRAGGQRQQAVVAGGQRAAEQRDDQGEVLDERRPAGDAGIEPPQHDLGDRQQREQRQRRHRQRVLGPL